MPRKPSSKPAAESVADVAQLPPDASAGRWRNRRVAVVTLPCGEVEPHPLNPRTHGPDQLGAVKGLLDEVGKIRPLIAFPADGTGRYAPGCRLMFCDGHGRERLDPSEPWEFWVLDLTRAEADKALFADRTGELADYDPARLDSLCREVQTGNEELAAMIAALHEETAQQAIDDARAAADAPEEFPEVDENIETAYCCPKCGYKWSGQPGGEGATS